MAGLPAALQNFLLLPYKKSDRRNYFHQIFLEDNSKVEPELAILYHFIIPKSFDCLTFSSG